MKKCLLFSFYGGFLIHYIDLETLSKSYGITWYLKYPGANRSPTHTSNIFLRLIFRPKCAYGRILNLSTDII